MQPQQKIETLLNDIYSQPDLKGGVFKYLQPPILKAYGLLKRDQLNVENGGQKIFTDLESKHNIEKILFRDLPEIIDVYNQMPLEYRNEHKLKTGKSHRDQLLDNLELLTKQLVTLEKSAYEGFDQKMAVKSRVFKEIYPEGSAEHEMESLKGSDDFTWQKPKSDLNRTVDTELFNKNDNKKIVVREDTIEYKVNDKFKHFMAGTYNFFNKVKKAAKSTGKASIAVTRFLTIGFSDEPVAWIFNGLFRPMALGFGVLTAMAGVFMVNQHYDEKPTLHLISAANKINLENERFKEISLAALEVYSKENNVGYKYSPAKDIVTLSVNQDKGECKIGLDTIKRNGFGHFNVNGIDMTKTSNISHEIAEGLCKTDGNVLTVNMKLKK